jgi:hypothetical protein
MRNTILSALCAAGVAACSGGVSGDDTTGDDTTGDDTPVLDEWDQLLADRTYDYNAALRSAALKLTGELPTLAEIHQVSDPLDDAAKKLAYEALITQYMASPKFTREVFYWWQDTLRMGDDPALDQAAAFAAQITVEGRPYTELFTATAGQCGSYDMGANTFTPGDCANGVAVHAGLLTHPGVMRQYYSNFAFRRVKWIQETFVCTKFPAEISATPIEVGGAAPYTGVHPFTSVPSLLDGGRINFQDTSAVICANCHTTMNHIAPLFAYFDDQGMYQPEIAVATPIEGGSLALLSDYLVPGEVTQWRFGVATPDLPALGQAIAADRDVAECAVARIWNWALSKGDIVDAMREVPPEVIQQQIDDFIADQYRLRDAIYNVFTSDDFVKF